MDCLPHVHTIAIHAPGPKNYETFTPGIGVLCRADTLLVGAGAYRNSNGDPSKYVAAGWQPLRLGPVRLGAMFGLVDGYTRRGGAFAPMGGVSLSWGNAHLLMWPRVANYTQAGVALSFTVE